PVGASSPPAPTTGPRGRARPGPSPTPVRGTCPASTGGPSGAPPLFLCPDGAGPVLAPSLHPPSGAQQPQGGPSPSPAHPEGAPSPMGARCSALTPPPIQVASEAVVL
ncbi:conserved hypothetical protein, partial [Ixodes scapularis]